MAKFKKAFWSGNNPEPSWYAEVPDNGPRNRGYRASDEPRKKGQTIPAAMVGNKVYHIKDAFNIYKRHSTDGSLVPFHVFKIGLINGSTFNTTEGLIRRPSEADRG